MSARVNVRIGEKAGRTRRRRTAEVIGEVPKTQNPKGGRPVKGEAPREEVAAGLNISERTLKRAEQHVETVEHWPFMRDWKQSQVLAVREAFELVQEVGRAGEDGSRNSGAERARKDSGRAKDWTQNLYFPTAGENNSVGAPELKRGPGPKPKAGGAGEAGRRNFAAECFETSHVTEAQAKQAEGIRKGKRNDGVEGRGFRSPPRAKPAPLLRFRPRWSRSRTPR